MSYPDKAEVMRAHDEAAEAREASAEPGFRAMKAEHVRDTRAALDAKLDQLYAEIVHERQSRLFTEERLIETIRIVASLQTALAEARDENKRLNEALDHTVSLVRNR